MFVGLITLFLFVSSSADFASDETQAAFPIHALSAIPFTPFLLCGGGEFSVGGDGVVSADDAGGVEGGGWGVDCGCEEVVGRRIVVDKTRGGRDWGAAVEEGDMRVCIARGGEEGESGGNLEESVSGCKEDAYRSLWVVIVGLYKSTYGQTRPRLL